MKVINVWFTFFLLMCSITMYAQSEEDYISTITLAPQLTGNVLIPMGIFTEIAPIGVGAGFNLSVRDLFIKNSALKLCMGYDFIYEELDAVNSFGMMSFSLLAGYRVLETGILSITPLVGAGYIGHVVDETESNLYFDPHLTVQTDFDIALFDNFSLCVTPGAIIFFEQNNIGAYVHLNIGVKADFDIALGGEAPVKDAPVPGLPRILIERDLPIFSPNDDDYKDSLVLAIKSDKTLSVLSYEIHILDKWQGSVRIFSGLENPPKKINWDGRSSNGGLAADGTYSAELTIKYEDGREQKTACENFVLDTTPPKVALRITPAMFSPDNDGENDTCTLECRVEEIHSIAHWDVVISDPVGNSFKTFSGSGDIPKKLIWNGRSDKGGLVESAMDYPFTLSVSDEAGNKTTVKDIIQSDIMVNKFGDKYKIIISNIHFDAYSSDYLKGSENHVKENLKIINRLVQILNKFKKYKIVIEGHALNLYWNDKEKAAKEETAVLVKLSRERAENIKQALVKKGIEAKRINAVGKGSTEPLVPFSDKTNNWKNRRVEILLVK
ncbi:MAG: OmpA family protein [Spirochaetales bacterium]|nr:OmpA family protein [Spirochaetales bacterium]